MLFTIVLIIILSIMIYIESISENLSSVGKITSLTSDLLKIIELHTNNKKH